jgi:Arc-like DNA binding domain
MKYQNIAPFGLRMQPDLKEKLETAAKGKPKWSLNSEIVKRLEDSLEVRYELASFSDGELVDELIRRWGRGAVYIELGKAKDEG